jgi:hypothetical protein
MHSSDVACGMWSRAKSAVGVRALCGVHMDDDDPLVVRQDLPRPAAERHVAQEAYGRIVRCFPHLLSNSSAIKGPLECGESVAVSSCRHRP